MGMTGFLLFSLFSFLFSKLSKFSLVSFQIGISFLVGGFIEF